MECLSRNLPPRETDFWYVCAGVGSARIEVVRVSGARPRHVRVRVVSRFSALQNTCRNIELRQMRAFSNYVSEWCGRAVAAQLLPGSCPIPARFLPSSRLQLPGSCEPGSCPVPARRPGPAGSRIRLSVGRFLRRRRASRASNRPAAASLSGAAPRMCGCFLLAIRENGALYSPSLLKLTRPQSKNKTNKKQARVVTVD